MNINMQNENQNQITTDQKKPTNTPTQSNATSTSLVLKKGQVMTTIPQNEGDNYIPDLSPSDEEDVSEVESFILDQEELDDGDASRFLLSHDTIEGAEVGTVDPETQAKLEALLEAAGIGKLSTPDGKAYADPEVLRRLTSSVSCALDEAAAALTRMRAEQTDGATPVDSRSLAKACSNGDIGTVRQLLDEGRSVNETTEEGESLLSLACSAGYFELAQVLLAMRANVEDRGIKGDCTPLMEAASGGYVDIVNLLIANGADVNAQSSAGNTPLHYAACGGHEDVVQVLIEATANVEEHNENGHTPLMEASSAGHVCVAKILLDSGAGINTHSNEFKESALTLACYKGHLEMVKFLLEAGADQEHKTDEMHTALMEASMDGHVEVARLLLDHGAQVNMPADSFESPLTLAACGGHVELANLLIERGANLEEVNDEGYTPLMEAAREGHEEMVALLLAHGEPGAYINAQTEETQETALTLACCGGFLDVAEFLIKAGSDLELGCSTPLMEAAQEGHLELVKYLIKAGASVHAQTQTGDTALTYACENGHTDVAEVLLDHGCSIEHESEGGRTPLMKAARAGHYNTVQFLISRGSDINKHTSTNDHTGLSLASAGGHRAVVDLLLKHGSNPNHRLKDGSTMLIEAAKGGHTTVVNLLLDWPGNLTSASSDLTQHSPPQSLNVNEMPRVPIHGLTNIVPPQDPDQVPLSPTNSTNNLSVSNNTITPGVLQESGQVNLKDFNIQTKSIEQMRPTMQKLLTKANLDTKVTLTTTTTTSTQGLIVRESSPSVDSAVPSNTTPIPSSLNNNDPQRASVNVKNGSNGEVTSGSIVDNSLSGSSSQVSEVGSDICAEGERTNPEMSTSSSSSTAFDSEDKMNEMMKASERLEAFISKMMRRAELLHTTSEEQSLQKQQILEELQKVEQELQEKAKNPLLLLNAQSKQDSMVEQCKEVLLQGDLSFDEDEYSEPMGMTLPVTICGPHPGGLEFDVGGLEMGACGLELGAEVEGAMAAMALMMAQGGEAVAELMEPMAADCEAVISKSLQGTYNGAALSFLSDEAEVKIAQLAKQESFSSASHSSNSSADSGCGNSDFNGVGVEGSEVDGPPIPAKISPLVAEEDEEPSPESVNIQQSPSSPSPADECDGVIESGEEGSREGSVEYSHEGGEAVSRASSEEVDLTNVIPLMEMKEDTELIDQQLQALHNHELLQQHVQEQLQAGADPAKIALGIQHQLQQQQQQMLQQQQLTQLAQQCLQSYPVQLEPLLQQPIATVLNPNNVPTSAVATVANSSCREMQLEHQRQHLQAQLELEQAKTKTLQAQLQLQKQIKTSNPQSSAKYHQQLKVQQQTTVTCQTQLATSDLQQLKLQQQLQHLHQQLQLHNNQQQQPDDSQQLSAQLSQQEILQQQLQQAQQLQLLHQQHLQKQHQKQLAVTTASSCQTGEQVAQVSSTQLQSTAGNQLLTQQELLQQTQQLQQQLHQVQQLQQMQQLALQQKHLGQYQQGNMWPVSTTTNTTTVANGNAQQKKIKKKHQLLPQQQQQLLQQQLLVNNQLNTQYANYTTASTNTMATGTNTLYDYLEFITPSPSTPITPNPSPASPQISTPVYPAVDLDAETESNHDTALTLACAGGHAELVSLLLSRGSDIEHRDKKGFTPLILAATAGHSDVVEILLDHGADIEAQSERTKDTPLSLACSGGRYEVVELLLTRGANKEHRNVSDYTPLSLAASGGYVNIIKLLLSHGAEINSRTGSKLGISPLMLAAMNGHTAAVKLLLDMGSDINAQIETNKNTALTLACFQGRHEVVSLLVDRRANIEHRAKTGLTPLMEAASGGYVEVGRVLLDKGADVNAPPVPSSRDTALTIAADKGHYRFVDLLLSRSAAIDVKNKKGNSPLWLACNGGHLDVVQLLVQANADVDSQDNRKVSCLMAAFRKGHIKVIKWLVKHVTQFPSDQECMRYISTVTDQELLKKCHQCMEIIVSAKARQAAEANRNASILLEEIDAERSREESKKAAAVRKREKKRKKKKEKQEREREQEKDKDQADGHSKSSSPEPSNNKDFDDEDDDDEEEEEEPPKKEEPKSKRKGGTDSSIVAARSSKELNTTNSAGAAPVSISVSNKNRKNQALARVSQPPSVVQAPVVTKERDSSSLNVTRTHQAKSRISEPPRNMPESQTATTTASSATSSSNSSSNRAKSKRRQRDKERSSHSREKEIENILDKNKVSQTVTAATLPDSTKITSAVSRGKAGTHNATPAMVPAHNNKTKSEHNNRGTGASHGTGSSGAGNANGTIPNMKQSPRTIPKISNTAISDLDDFGMLPPPPPPAKVTPAKEKEKKTPDKVRVAMDALGVLSPAKANSLKSANVPSPGKRGQKKDEGWKEVIRKSKKVSVASSAISRVIGRNGCNINAIREVSGAHIEIDKARSSGDRNITIKGSVEATRQAHNLITALIKDPDKELEQIMPKLKNRVVSTNTLTLSTSVWHNSMANGVSAAPGTQPTTVVTTLVNTVTTSILTGNHKTNAKSSTAAVNTKATGLSSTVTTTVTQSAPGKAVMVTSSNTRPQSSTMSNIGVFQVPIGVWNASMAQGSAPGGGRLPLVSTPQSVQQARRQLFPSDKQGVNMSAANKPATYSSPSMSKTKVVNVATPAIASREMKGMNSLPGGRVQQPQPALGSPVRPPQAPGPYTSKEPLPIKSTMAPNPAGNKPIATSHPNGAQAEFYSPFNTTFSPFGEQVLGKKDEVDAKMNFASVAAAGVVVTSAPTGPMQSGAATHRELDTSLQAKAPGYKAPGAQRTSSPLIEEPNIAARAPGFSRMGPADMDPSRIPGFKPPHMMGNPEYDQPRMPEEFGLHYAVQRAQMAAEHQSRMSQMANMSPGSASSNPISIQSLYPHHHHHHHHNHMGMPNPASFKDEYSTPDQPMTLPKIESNLNPNAPDFTFGMQANHQLQQQLLAARILAQHQQQHQQQQQQQQHQQQQPQQQQQQQQQTFNPMGPGASTGSNMPFIHPGIRLPPPFVLAQQGMGDMSGAAGQSMNIPEQLTGFGGGGAYHSLSGGNLGDSGSSGLSPNNRQYSPMPLSATRSESAASSVGTSSKGESSPAPHVSGESSPLSSSAPSPTDQFPQFLDDGLQQQLPQHQVRPIGTGRSGKRERMPQAYGDMGDEHLWGIARELGSDWMVGNSSMGVSTTVSSNVSLMSHGLQSDVDEPRPCSQPPMSTHLIPGLLQLEASSVLDPAAVELALHNSPLLIPGSTGALFASNLSGSSSGSMPMSKVYPHADNLGGNVGLSGDSLGSMWPQQPQGPTGHMGMTNADPGAPDPKMMWNTWTPPPSM